MLFNTYVCERAFQSWLCTLANIKRNLVYNFLLSCSQVLIPLLSIPYISRVLDPEGIGKVSFLDSFTFYIVTIAEFGITVYGIREVAKVNDDPLRLNVVISELVMLHLISSSLSLLLYVTGVYLLWDKIQDIRLIIFSGLFLIANFFSIEWYFWGRERFGYIALRTIIVRLSGLAAIFLFIKSPADFFIYYAIIVTSSIITIVWNMTLLLREVTISFKKVNWRRHLGFVWVTYLINIVYCIPLMLDNVLLGLISTASAVGIYSFSVKVVRISTNLISDSFLVFFPRIVSLSNDNEIQKAQYKILHNIQLITLLAIPLGAGIFLLSDELADAFFGNKFSDAATDLRILSLFPFVKAVSLFFSNPLLIAHNLERNFLRNLIVASCLFIVSVLLLGHFYGHLGVCIGLVGSELALLMLNYFSVRKNLNNYKVFDWQSVTHAVAGSLLFIPLIFLVKSVFDEPLIRLAFSIISCFLIFIFFIVFLAKNDFAVMIKNMLVKEIRRWYKLG